MTIEQWARRLNKLSREIEGSCRGVHPSAWRAIAGHKMLEWSKLAAAGPTKSRLRRLTKI